jgi:hypothetical protein
VLWFVLTVGLVMAHGTNNLLNDLVDYQRGVDKDNYFRAQYGPQPLVTGLLSMKGLLTYAAVTGLIRKPRQRRGVPGQQCRAGGPEPEARHCRTAV